MIEKTYDIQMDENIIRQRQDKQIHTW